jgi:hypothetical protein
VDSGESECSTDKDCPPGFVCEQETWCPCPPDTEPACGAPCQLIGKCVQAGGACYGDEDCLPGEVCVIDNDCCPPKGCKPGDICPAVCVACGACQAAPQPVECKKLNPAGYGMCAMVLGVGWDGTKCVTISGCSCGSDCAFFFKTLSDCQAACGPWIL